MKVAPWLVLRKIPPSTSPIVSVKVPSVGGPLIVTFWTSFCPIFPSVTVVTSIDGFVPSVNAPVATSSGRSRCFRISLNVIVIGIDPSGCASPTTTSTLPSPMFGNFSRADLMSSADASHGIGSVVLEPLPVPERTTVDASSATIELIATLDSTSELSTSQVWPPSSDR